ncbi:MAG: low molecular weight phosphotyrosine protein phosphatase [Synechococcaceae cyanobacterium SM2_3_2]|nr:low molecular weight phosphotyrosine protein phosphatase [Synechococcaceae cyanobacterium SM2_3_2]
MTPPTKLLFVCLGNICRSPAAENIMDHLLKTTSPELEILCDSAGTGSYHVGSAPDRRMTQAAQRQGIEMQGRARQLMAADLAEFDLILAMDRDNFRNIQALDPSGRYASKIKMMCDYCADHDDKEVPDPYYGGESGFQYVIELLTDACQGLLAELKTSSPQDSN